eukprot:gb/GECH01004028.1/.p1 GENE.gb/GECH01004028.1/~~gb/GECH01004028.1/.p1  ORF type:complete len:638 (+),score=126.58 gb/GECH01004028.1/:1-1914(+)
MDKNSAHLKESSSQMKFPLESPASSSGEDISENGEHLVTRRGSLYRLRKSERPATSQDEAFRSLPFGKPLRVVVFPPRRDTAVGEKDDLEDDAGVPYQVGPNTTVMEFLKANDLHITEDGQTVLGVTLNHEITHLDAPLDVNCDLVPLTENSEDGCRIYRKSLVFLLSKAHASLFPNRRLIIGHSVHNAYYFYYEDTEDGRVQEIRASDVSRLSKEMQRYVLDDLPIYRSYLSYPDAVSFFDRVQPLTAALLRQTNRAKIPVYHCGKFVDVCVETIANQAGALDNFELRKYKNGLLLNYPIRGSPFKDNECLYNSFVEHRKWSKALDLTCIGEINALAHRGGIDEFIQINETLHDNKIADIARSVAFQKRSKLVLIAGPSSSGKTTFSRKLAMQLRVSGLQPYPLSLDNYYLERGEMTPLADGSYDLESVDALALDLLNDHLKRLLQGEEVVTPKFDFLDGKRKSGSKLKLPDDGVLILEGIHGLNDRLTEQIKRNQKFKIYLSPITQLNIDDHNRISVTEIRLIRRIVRDHQFRGYSALRTLKVWKSVREGETKFIFPFHSPDLDATFNSSLDYELNVLKVYAEPLLRTVKPSSPQYATAIRLLQTLDLFAPVPSKFVPNRSLIREFVGGSLFNVH